MLIQNGQLTSIQLLDLDKLYAICEKADGGTPVYYRHILAEPRDKNNILYYQDSQLIACISVYFFYQDACEISLLVHPDYRDQGIARQLLTEIFPRINEALIQQLIFSMPPPADEARLLSMGFTYQESEYQMRRSGTNFEPIKTNRLVLRDARIEDIPSLLDLDSACFVTQSSHCSDQYCYWLAHPNYHLIVAYYQDQLIGKAHIRRDNHGQVTLSDIAIFPKFQRQGLGSELLANTIQIALQEGASELCLDVATDNASNAVNLYLKHGFKIMSQHDFWSISPRLLIKRVGYLGK